MTRACDRCANLFVFPSASTVPSVLSLIHNETCVVRCSVMTRELATRIPWSLKVTATVTSPPGLLGVCGGVPSVGTTTSSRPTVTCQELRYQLPLLVLCGSRVELNHHPGKWQTKRSKRFCKIKWRVSVVSCEVVHVLNPRAGGWESPSNTCVWSANEGLRRTDGTSGGFPFERGRQKKRACSLGPAALIGLHVRNCWFGGRHTCADTCEESRQMKEIGWIWMKADRWTSGRWTRLKE